MARRMERDSTEETWGHMTAYWVASSILVTIFANSVLDFADQTMHAKPLEGIWSATGLQELTGMHLDHNSLADVFFATYASIGTGMSLYAFANLFYNYKNSEYY